MLEFIITTVFFFLIVVFLVIFLRKDIFETSQDNGFYQVISQGTCQNGVRYEAYECNSINNKACLDRFGNLTYDIFIKPIVCLNSSPQLASNIRRSIVDTPSNRRNSTISRNCELPDGCYKEGTKGKRKIIKDCSLGCVSADSNILKVRGGINLHILPKNKLINVEDHTIVKKTEHLYLIDNEEYNYEQANKLLNFIVEEEECVPILSEVKHCESSNNCPPITKPFEKCPSKHLEEGLIEGSCSIKCLGYSEEAYSELDIAQPLKNVLHSKFLTSGNEYLTCNNKSKICWQIFFHPSIVEKEGIKVSFYVVNVVNKNKIIVQIFCQKDRKNGWYSVEDDITDSFSKNRKEFTLSVTDGKVLMNDKILN